MNGEAIRETFSPIFTLTYNRTALGFDSSLRRSEPKDITVTAIQKQNWSAAGLVLPLTTARATFFGLGLISLLGASGLAAMVFLGIGRPEEERIKARYGTKLVSVTEAEPSAHRIQVSHLDDLAVLAQRDGKIIFTRKLDDGDLFFVPDGATTYEYARHDLSRKDGPGDA